MSLHLNPFHGNGWVIQRGRPCPVRGDAAPDAEISVIHGGIRVQTRADAGGQWTAWLPPRDAGGPSELRVSSGHAVRVLEDVCVGDVWICAGQSNMEMPLAGAETGPRDAAAANDPLLRLARLSTRVASQPAATVSALTWTGSTPEPAAGFSAIGWYFGVHLRERLRIPIGLVQAAVGATPAEAWVPFEILAAESEYAPILERWRRGLAIHPDPDKTVEAAFAAWDRAADQAEREGRPIPGAHPKLVGPGHPWTPAGLYQGMIHPLTQFPIRGVIWYQGAAAPERADQYRDLFRRLIRAWRSAWQQDDFPFLYLQEANFGTRRETPGEQSWAELREAQAMARSEPNTAMGVAIDLGEADNIHPVRKQPLGNRLALLARQQVYGEQDLAASSPFVQGHRIENGRIRVQFEPTYGALKTADGGAVRGFAISGGATDFTRGDRGFVWANAVIEGDTVVVSSPRVPRPVAVRYGWAQNPDVNLVNAAGLPAGPFRTDSYPGVTSNNR